MSDNERKLRYIIEQTLWMARRYADGRRTYAPSDLNQCIDLALSLGIDIKPDYIHEPATMYARDGDFGLWDKDMQCFLG